MQIEIKIIKETTQPPLGAKAIALALRTVAEDLAKGGYEDVDFTKIVVMVRGENISWASGLVGANHYG